MPPRCAASRSKEDDRQTAIGRDFAGVHNIGKPYYAAPGDGIFHFYLPEQGPIVPGGFYPGGDSHSCAYGAFGIGVEFVDRDRQLPMPHRNTIANMMAEGEAQNGLFARDDLSEAWYRERGIDQPYPRLVSGFGAAFEIDESLVLDEVVPMIARPFSPGNAFPAGEVAREKMKFDKALIGSCTNGSYDDLLGAALILRALFRLGRRFAQARPERHHHLQSQLAEPHGYGR